MSFLIAGVTGAEITGILVALTTQNILSAIDVAATRWWERRKMSMPLNPPPYYEEYDPGEENFSDGFAAAEPTTVTEVVEPMEQVAPPPQIEIGEKIVLAAGTINQLSGEVVPKFNGTFKGLDPQSGLAFVRLNMGGKIGTIDVLVDPAAIDKS